MVPLMAANPTDFSASSEILQSQRKLLEIIRRAASKKWGNKNRKRRLPYTAELKRFLEDETLNPNFHTSGSTPLTMAAMYPESPWVLEALLDSGKIEIDLPDDGGRTALSIAAEFQGTSCVKTLLGYGAKCDSRDNSGRSPLSWASTPRSMHDNNKEVIDLLVAGGADVNSEDKGKATPLMWATKKRRQEVVSYLVSLDTIDLDYRDIDNRSPLSYAAEVGLSEIAHCLINSGADINLEDQRNFTPLMWATMNRHLNIVRDLLLTGAVEVDHQDTTNRTPLLHASERGYDDIVPLLLESGANVKLEDRNQRTPLTLATINRHKYIICDLLSIDAVDVDHQDFNDRTPLSYAAELGYENIVRHLVKSGANVNLEDKDQHTPLIWATVNGHNVIVELLLSVDNINIDHQDIDNRSSLSYAAELGYESIICLLIKSGANVNLGDKNKHSLLIWATINGHDAIVELLLSVDNINIDHRDIDNRSCLSYAAELGLENTVRRLIKLGANVNSEDRNQQTPLIWATIKGYNAIVELLLSVGNVNVDHQDIDNRTPLSYAAEAGNTDIMECLLKAGADETHANQEGYTCVWLFLRNRQSPERHKLGNPFRMLFWIALLRDRDYVDQYGRTFLSWAAEFGDDLMVQALLENGANPNIRDWEQRNCKERYFSKTPLIWALENEHKSVVQLLKDRDKSSLHLLLRESHTIGEERALKLVQGLIKAEYNIEQTDAEGKRPLHLASVLPNTDFTSALIKAKPELDARDNFCYTPLQYAVTQRNERVVQMLLGSGAGIEPVQPKCWFKLIDPLIIGSQRHYIELIRRGQIQSYVKQTILQNNFQWIPPPGEYKLCLHTKEDVYWSKLYRDVDTENHQIGYFSYGHLKKMHTSDTLLASHLSVSFPSQGGRKGMSTFWGIEWGVRYSSKHPGYGFISTLPSSDIPENIPDFFNRFLEHLQQVWEDISAGTIRDVEYIRSDQLERQGKSRVIIDRLARNARRRTELRRCLQQHIEGLRKAVDADPTIEVDSKLQLAKSINQMQKSVTARLDDVEEVMRDLLQIELTWVSINEAGSTKRLSWITFIFLPLMFVSSLFGMNIDLLQNNPDWRWYPLIAGSCLLLTTGIWAIVKFSAIESRVERMIPQRKKRRIISDASIVV